MNVTSPCLVAAALLPAAPALAAAQAPRERATLKGLKNNIDVLAISPDGKTLAAAVRFGNTVVLWDVAGGKEKSSLKLEPHPYRVAFTPDGKTLAVGCAGGTVVLFEMSGKDWRLLIRRAAESRELCRAWHVGQ